MTTSIAIILSTFSEAIQCVLRCISIQCALKQAHWQALVFHSALIPLSKHGTEATRLERQDIGLKGTAERSMHGLYGWQPSCRQLHRSFPILRCHGFSCHSYWCYFNASFILNWSTGVFTHYCHDPCTLHVAPCATRYPSSTHYTHSKRALLLPS